MGKAKLVRWVYGAEVQVWRSTIGIVATGYIPFEGKIYSYSQAITATQARRRGGINNLVHRVGSHLSAEVAQRA